MKTLRFLLETREEIQAALDRHAGIKPDLGARLDTEINLAMRRMSENPLHYAIESSDGVRYCPIDDFPYFFAFIDGEAIVMVIAFSHGRRRPGYYRNRIKSIQ
jgi:toxin ParE1/3/4